MTPAQTDVERVARAIMDHRLGAGTYDNASLWQGADAEKEETRREARTAIAAMQPSVADMDETSVGDIGNFYGGLSIRCIGGKPEWCIENHDGYHWEDCPASVFTALHALTEGADNDL